MCWESGIPTFHASWHRLRGNRTDVLPSFFPLFPLVLLFLQLFNMRINMIIFWLILLFKYMYIDKTCRKGGWAYSISLLYRNENLQLRKRWISDTICILKEKLFRKQSNILSRTQCSAKKTLTYIQWNTSKKKIESQQIALYRDNKIDISK